MAGVVAAVAAGYGAGMVARSPAQTSTPEDRAMMRPLSEAMGSSRDALEDPARIAARAAIERALDSAKRTAHESALRSRLGDEAEMVRLHRALIAQSHREVEGVDEYAKEFAIELAFGKDGVPTVRSALGRLPASEFPLERVAMITALASNPRNAEVVSALAKAELTEDPPAARPDPRNAKTEAEVNEGLSTTAAQVRPLAAYGILVQTAKDPAEILSATVAGIESQTDWGIRSQLAMQFMTTYPDQAPSFKSALASRGITVQESPGQETGGP